jgi:hypothetical protein
MIDRFFLEHPKSVDETYVQHMRVASGFGARMLLASLACFVHAIVPGLFVRTGSATIIDLHDRMVASRRRRQHQHPAGSWHFHGADI